MYERYTGLPDPSIQEPSGTRGRDAARSSQGGRRGTTPKSAGRTPARAASDGLVSYNIYPERAEAYDRGGSSYGQAAAPSRGGSSARGSGSSSSRSGGSGGGRPRKSAARRKKEKQRRLIVGIGTVVILALLIVAIAVMVKSCTGDVEPLPQNTATTAYRSGVTVNGIDISGKTVDEARTLVQPGVDYTIANIAITLKTDNFSQMITGPEMEATSDLEELLVTALSGGAGQTYYTKINFNDAALQERVVEINAGLATGPVEPSFTIDLADSGKPTFNYVEGKQGYGLDVTATLQLVHDALNNNQLQATLTPTLSYQQPTMTLEELKNNTTLRGEFSTSYRAKAATGTDEEKRITENRAFNVAKGAEKINNVVIRPGKTWSFNNEVGDRSEKNGWKEAKGITGGDRYNLQYGGGICQVSTTLYNAILLSNLEITSRRHHSIPSDYVDLGLDATVDSDHIDFKFKNSTEHNIYIFAYVTSSKNGSRWRDIVVRVYGEALPEGTTYKARSVVTEVKEPGEPVVTYNKKQMVDYVVITAEARKGYEVDVFLDTYVNGKKTVETFLYHDTYDAIAEKRTEGTLPLPTDVPIATDVPVIVP